MNELRTIAEQLNTDFERLSTEPAQAQTERPDLDNQREIIKQQALHAILQVRHLEQEIRQAMGLGGRANSSLHKATLTREDAKHMPAQAKQERFEIMTEGVSSSITANRTKSGRDATTRPTSTLDTRATPDCDKELPALPKHIAFAALPAGHQGPKVPLRNSPIPARTQQQGGTMMPPPGFHAQPSRDQRIANMIACHRALDELEPTETEYAVPLRKESIPTRKQNKTGSAPPPPGLGMQPSSEQRAANLAACRAAPNRLKPTKAGSSPFAPATTASATLGPLPISESAPRKFAYARRLVDLKKPPPPFILRRSDGKLVSRDEIAQTGMGAMEPALDPFFGCSSGVCGLPEHASRVAATIPPTGSSGESDSESGRSEEESPSALVARRIATKQLLKRPQVLYVSTKRHQTIYPRPGIPFSASTGDANGRTTTPDATPPGSLRLRWKESFSMPDFLDHTVAGPLPLPRIRSHNIGSCTEHSLRNSPQTPAGQFMPTDRDQSEDADADDELDDTDDSGPIVSGYGILNRAGAAKQTSYTPPGLPHDHRKVPIVTRKMSGPDEVSNSSDDSSFKSKRHSRKTSEESKETVMPESRDSDQLPVISPGASDSSFGAGSSLMSEDLRASTRRWIGCVPKGKRSGMPVLRRLQ